LITESFPRILFEAHFYYLFWLFQNFLDKSFPGPALPIPTSSRN
jgi:hypothetical protein